MIIDKHHPWIHATPDVMTSCLCCGDGCCEVKCPYSIDSGNFEAYVEKKESCLEKISNTFRLKRSHQYYHQVQQQLFVTDRKHCDFVVCSFLNNKQTRFFYGENLQGPLPLGFCSSQTYQDVENLYTTRSSWQMVYQEA